MASTIGEDGSEDVNDFLARIRELGDQRDREEEERSKKLEEDIAKGRQERAARRAERARSISPTKDSPASTLSMSTAATRSVFDTPTSRAVNITPPKQTLGANVSDSLVMEPSKPDPPSQSSLSRSNTLSWQQRPSRASATVRNRPISVASPESVVFKSPSTTPEPHAREGRNPAVSNQPIISSAVRSAISSSPTSHPMTTMFADKDPDWFRQTADRGKSSAAYRKSEEPERGFPSIPGNVRMPGMSRDSGMLSNKEVNGSGSGDRPEHKANLGSIRLEPSTSNAISKEPTMSPSQDRISPERTDRPSSPTKGIGGFVQSAMLKRSDSVTKRWSAQAGQSGIMRGNSTSGNRASRDIDADLKTRSGNARTPSPTKVTPPEDDFDDLATSLRLKDGEKQAQESSEPLSVNTNAEIPAETSISRPSSPVKDTRRWSPVKSSWLEKAINKPDLAKPQKPASRQQPAWMAEIQKAKAARVGAGNSKTADDSATESSSKAQPLLQAEHTKSIVHQMDESVIIPSSTADDSKEKRETPVRNGADATGQISASEPLTSKNSTVGLKRESPLVKPKLETPPKKDFRANLRRNTADVEKEKEDVPEFKKAFGNLKRAETKNYVAPDTLKDTITKSKTGLNITGGPQKSQRVDEFKESILTKKKEFSAISTKPPVRNPSQIGEKLVPEALAKRAGMLNRTQSSSNASQAMSNIEAKMGDRTESSTLPTPDKLIDPSPSTSTPLKGSALATRFNPNLAGLLARGPLTGSSSSPERSEISSIRPLTEETVATGPELTHATKARARGPKRKLPSSKQIVKSTRIETSDKASPTPVRSAVIEPEQSKKNVLDDQLKTYNAIKESLLGNVNTVGSLITSETAILPRDSSVSVRKATAAASPKIEPPAKTLATTKPKLPTPSSPSNRVTGSSASLATTSPIVSRGERGDPGVISSIDRSKFAGTKPSLPAKPVTSIETGSSTTGTPPIKPKPNSPDIKRSGVFVHTASQKPSDVLHDDVSQPNTPTTSGVKNQEASQDRLRGPKPSGSPAVPAKKSTVQALSTLKTTPKSGQESSAAQVIYDFFGPTPSGKARPEIDTQSLLSSYSKPTDKIRSLRKQIWELTSDGKRIPITAQQEHILFEDSMYICTHVFGSMLGKHTTEAYLWIGDGVSPSAADDAQLFARNIAKEAGTSGKLVILQQGKESANFLEALGGILIIRRGSSKDSSKTYMLCGRKHMGQIAFDEVDFGGKSLCSGFPFIVTAGNSACYLWKGRGSSADELGCARLIAMDIGLTGEIEEVDEGKEPATFWKTLQGQEIDASRIGQHWPLKASKEGFVTRLYVIGDARPKSGGLGALWARRGSTPGIEEPGTGDIQEIRPYAQCDLAQDGIFVLDAYFEVYVLLGWRSSSRFLAFKSAVCFAQEYAILAASNEDRPFVPAARVVFAGASSTYLKTAFRKWDDTRVTTQPTGDSSGSVSLPLHDVITAMSD